MTKKITRADVEAFREVIEAAPSVNQLELYQRIATQSAFYPGQGTALGLAYCALKLNGEAGEFAEHVGKAMRDDALIVAELQSADEDGTKFGKVGFGQPTDARRTALIKEAGDVLWYLSAICNELGVSFGRVALMNLEKLCDRGERDVLPGSGDDR